MLPIEGTILVSRSKTSLNDRTVLIVESQELIRTILVDILRTVGIKNIQIARNGSDGIQQIRTWMPDVIFCDSDIGTISGLELVEWVRTDPSSPNPQVPVIYITSDRNQQTILKARDTGISELIIKPIVPQAVVSRLKSVFINERDFVRSHSFVGPDRRRNRNRTYKGGKRRLNDSTGSQSGDISEAERRRVLEAVDIVLAETPHINANDRNSVMSLYRKSEHLWDIAQDTDDQDLEVVTKSLLKYIQAVGVSGRLNSKLITLHLDATRQLSAHEGQPNRRGIVTQLANIVDRALRSRRSA